MQVQYVGPFDSVDVPHGNLTIVAPRGELIDVPDDLGERLLEQAVWADDSYDLKDATVADIVDWVEQDHQLAEVAIAEERRRAKPRAGVLEHCYEVLGVAASPETLGVDLAPVEEPESDPEPAPLKVRSVRRAKAGVVTEPSVNEAAVTGDQAEEG